MPRSSTGASSPESPSAPRCRCSHSDHARRGSGDRRTVTARQSEHRQRFRNAAFYTAMAVLVIALNSPLDALSEQLFWAHMVQHVLLLLVAPPLIVLARPWVRLWR